MSLNLDSDNFDVDAHVIPSREENESPGVSILLKEKEDRVGDTEGYKVQVNKNISKLEDLSDSELVARSAQKDREAYRILVERYQARAYTIAFAVLQRKEDAEDVVQESFVKAYLSLPGFKSQSTFYTWFYRIVRNMSIDVKRKVTRESKREVEIQSDNTNELESEMSLAVEGESPDDQLLRKEKMMRISKVLQDISEEHRTVIMLREIEGMDYQEIAKVTGVSKGTIMSRLHYARKKLQQALGDLVSEDLATERS